MRRAVLAGLVVWTVVVLVASLGKATWISPPVEGVGAFPAQWPRWVIAGLCIGLPWVVLGLLHVRNAEGPTVAEYVVLGVCLLGGVVAVVPIANAENEGRSTVGEGGFSSGALFTNPGKRIVFYNATKEPVTVCLGRDGRCADDPAGPAGLRGDGLVVPPGRRVGSGPVAREVTLHITLAGAGPEVAGRNADVEVREPSS